MDADVIIKQLKQHLPAILENRPVQLAYLYGSVPEGYTHPFSDVDIALVLDPQNGLDPLRPVQNLTQRRRGAETQRKPLSV